MSNEACFLHVREGGYNSISEDELLQVRGGQSVLMKCGNYLSQMIADEKTGLYQAIAVHFHPEVLRRIYASDLPSFLTSKKRYESTNMALVHASAAIDKYIEDVLFYFDHPQLANEDMLIIKTKEIILLLMQTEEASAVSQILENLFSERTVGFKKMVEAHLFSDLTLNEFAQLSNMSLSSFKRKFRSIYNASPQEYIYIRRLEKSKELLIVSDLSVADIAFDCGFKTLSHFSRRFKEAYQSSPSDFRLTHSSK